MSVPQKVGANYHHSTFCQLPPAYINTKFVQILISVDYVAESHDFEGTLDENTNKDPTNNPNSAEINQCDFCNMLRTA
ncbi:ankyrin and armadillo repeat-containing protein [Porphyrio hochstetteri]